MKRIQLIKITACLAVALFAGQTAAQAAEIAFYGVKMKSESIAEEILNREIQADSKTIPEIEGIDKRIYARARMEYGPTTGNVLTVRVFNRSDKPINANYHFTGYTIVTKDGERFEIDENSILLPPDLGVIKPGQTAIFRPGLAGVNLKKWEVKMTICSFSLGETKIILLPVAEKRPPRKLGTGSVPFYQWYNLFPKTSEGEKKAPVIRNHAGVVNWPAAAAEPSAKRPPRKLRTEEEKSFLGMIFGVHPKEGTAAASPQKTAASVKSPEAPKAAVKMTEPEKTAPALAGSEPVAAKKPVVKRKLKISSRSDDRQTVPAEQSAAPDTSPASAANVRVAGQAVPDEGSLADATVAPQSTAGGEGRSDDAEKISEDKQTGFDQPAPARKNADQDEYDVRILE